jgi:hypothetical protein
MEEAWLYSEIYIDQNKTYIYIIQRKHGYFEAKDW